MLIPPLKRAFALMQSLELMPQCVLERIVLLQAVQLNRRGKYRERLLQLNPACPEPCSIPCTQCCLWLGAQEPEQPQGLQAVCLWLFSEAEKALFNTLSFLLPLPSVLCWFESLSCWEGLSMCPGNRGAWGVSLTPLCDFQITSLLETCSLQLFGNNWNNVFGAIEILRKLVEWARIKLWWNEYPCVPSGGAESQHEVHEHLSYPGDFYMCYVEIMEYLPYMCGYVD